MAARATVHTPGTTRKATTRTKEAQERAAAKKKEGKKNKRDRRNKEARLNAVKADADKKDKDKDDTKDDTKDKDEKSGRLSKNCLVFALTLVCDVGSTPLGSSYGGRGQHQQQGNLPWSRHTRRPELCALRTSASFAC